MKDKSHLTAISRKKPSLPMAYLSKNIGFEFKSVLDYGCGRGFDSIYYGINGFDPMYQPILHDYKYDIVTCNYVLNVLPKTAEKRVLKKIHSLLNTDGVAYITVRRDKFKEGYTSKGTYQRYVELDLPVLYKTSGYIIYEMRR